jgi:hypothetical protein
MLDVPMRFAATIRVVVTSCAASLLFASAGWGQSQSLSLDEIVHRVQQAQINEGEQSVAYAVTREYQLSAAVDARPSSVVIAEVNFMPPAAKDYSIVTVEGSERGAGIVRRVLDHEARMASQANTYRLTNNNYAFALLGREVIDGHDCYLLKLSPKRAAAELIDGKAWVDADDFALRKIDGRTAKTPTFWIKSLAVTINYSQVNGVWVQASTRAVADVRFAGEHVLTSRELEVRPSALDAHDEPPQARRARPRHGIASPAAWMAQ